MWILKKKIKRNTLYKVVRAKLPGPWEGGGIGGKKHTEKFCFMVVPPISYTKGLTRAGEGGGIQFYSLDLEGYFTYIKS